MANVKNIIRSKVREFAQTTERSLEEKNCFCTNKLYTLLLTLNNYTNGIFNYLLFLLYNFITDNTYITVQKPFTLHY